MTYLPCKQLSGPLDRGAAQHFVHNCSAAHQYRQYGDFHILAFEPAFAWLLDAAALASIIEYLREYYPGNDLERHLTVLQGGIKIIPRPEPEVRAAQPKMYPLNQPKIEAAPPEPEPEPESGPPRWRARVKTKLYGGRVYDEEHDIDEVDELADIIERGPDFGAIKKIKIQLEYRL